MKFNITISILSVLVSLFSCQEKSDETPPSENEKIEAKALFQKGLEGYSCYRIPAIIKSKEGTLLAFAEARNNGCSDEGDIDMVVRRSTDNGKTWSNLIVIWSDGENTCGNPAPVVDQSTGAIYLLMSWNFGTDDIGMINRGIGTDTRRVFVTKSDDDGVTWTEPKEITSDVKLDTWGWYATGPCHGIQLAKGEHAGRLIVPCDNIELKSAGGKGFSHVIYSDDHGETWHLGGVTPEISIGTNESTVAELSDGKLLLNMRAKNNNNQRMVSTSSDGGLSWTSPVTDYELRDPVCQGSLLSAEINGNHMLFFSNPSSTERENLTIRLSENDGETWSESYQVNPGPSAYSDIVMVSDEEIAVLYEAGKSKPYDGIFFKTVLLTDF